MPSAFLARPILVGPEIENQEPKMSLTIVQHPLAAHVMTHLRDKTTKPATFRTLTYQLSLLLAMEATRDLATT